MGKEVPKFGTPQILCCLQGTVLITTFKSRDLGVQRDPEDLSLVHEVLDLSLP